MHPSLWEDRARPCMLQRQQLQEVRGGGSGAQLSPGLGEGRRGKDRGAAGPGVQAEGPGQVSPHTTCRGVNVRRGPSAGVRALSTEAEGSQPVRPSARQWRAATGAGPPAGFPVSSRCAGSDGGQRPPGAQEEVSSEADRPGPQVTLPGRVTLRFRRPSTPSFLPRLPWLLSPGQDAVGLTSRSQSPGERPPDPHTQTL